MFTLFQTVRYEPKDFRQRRPDGNNGWLWNLNGVRLVPYHLPDVQKAKSVIITEGEKDADNLNNLGLTATTCPMGSGKWRNEYNEYFQDKRIVILPDNDDPGRKHAQAIAENLKGIAESIKIVELPDLPRKGDVSDWISKGGTKDQLIELIKVTQEWSDNQSKPTCSLTQQGILSILQDDKVKSTVHPAQDFSKGVMSFAIKAGSNSCLVTSNRSTFSFDQASSQGINLKHNIIDRMRFSPEGVIAFVQDKKEIDIPGLYQRIHQYISRFISFPSYKYSALISLWCIGTYVFMIFRYFPYIWLNAEKSSGKTLLMEVLSAIAFNGQLITSPTEAVIYRDVSCNLVTMFIDEVEQLRKRDKDIYGAVIRILNQGFNKSALVQRLEPTNKGHIMKQFSAYSPKMFAGINEIDDVLQDRTIRVPLRRKKESERLERYKETPGILQLQKSIRDDLYIFALLYGPQIALLYHQEQITGLEHLTNRELDIWEPIFALANVIDAASNDTQLTQLMSELSQESLNEKQDESKNQNETYKVLSVLKSMLEDLEPLSKEGFISVYDADMVLEHFKKTDEFEWLEKKNALTKRLKKAEVRSDQRRKQDGTKFRVYLINHKEVEDLCERYSI